MTNYIQNNAYRILGLDTSASPKEILKRSKEITARLKIDDLPEYDLDFNLDKNLRSEESITNAVKILQNNKTVISQIFLV